jgi:hypothetical protein
MRHNRTNFWILLLFVCEILIAHIYFTAPESQLNRSPSIPKTISEIPQPQQTQQILANFSAVDIRGWGMNWQELYLFSSLEAVVNRNHSRLFVIRDSTEELWFQSLNSSHYHGTLLQISSIRELFELYADEISGIILMDDLPESANIATPMVGIYNAVIVHANLLESVRTWQGMAVKPIVQNLTALYQTQGFSESSSRGAIYRWAFDAFFTNYNQTALAMLNTGIASHLRSFLCMNRIFTLWQPVMAKIEGAPLDDELTQATFHYILDNTPQDMIVYGYMFPDGKNEHPVVGSLSAAGKYLVPSDFSKNLPFYAHLPIPENFQFTQYRSESMPSVENKIYIAGIFSDGDNIQYVANRMRKVYWESERRLSNPVPVAFEISPSLLHIAPYMLYYFYSTATANDYFVPGVGGKGYVLSNKMTPNYFRQYYQTTLDLMERTDMREMRTWDSPITDVVNVFSEYRSEQLCDAIVDGYGGRGLMTPYMVKNVSVTSMLSYAGDPVDDLENMYELKKIRSGPLFVVFHLYCWDTTYESWAEFVDTLAADPTFEVVRLDEMSHLIHQYHTQAGVPNITPEFLETLWIISIIFWAAGFLMFEFPAIQHSYRFIGVNKFRFKKGENYNWPKFLIKWSVLGLIHLIMIGAIGTMLYFSQPLRIRGLFEILGQNHRMHLIPIYAFYPALVGVSIGYFAAALLYRIWEKKHDKTEFSGIKDVILSVVPSLVSGGFLAVLLINPWTLSFGLFGVTGTYLVFGTLLSFMHISIKSSKNSPIQKDIL